MAKRGVERGHCNGCFGRDRASTAGIGPAAANPGETVSAAAHALPRGDLVLDRYRPLRPLGSGGSGSVWLARDERNGLDVALKIVPREGKAADRAEREAEAASRLRHERCLRAYGFGSDSGHVYIAYEYVGGRTLRDAMRSGDLRRRPGRRGGGADPRRARARPQPRHRPSRRQAVERPARRGRRHLGAPARLRARAVRRGRDADRGRRRPRHARVHLPRAAPRRGGLLGERRLGGRDPALGGARRASTRSGACRCRRWPARSRRAARRCSRSGPTCRSGCWPRSRTRPRTTRRSARPPRRWRRSCAALSRAASVRKRSKVLLQHKLSSERARSGRRRGRGCARRRHGAAVLPHRLGARAGGAGGAGGRSARRVPGSRSRSRRRFSRSATTRSGSALLYGAVAAAWLVLFWRDARWGLAFLAGPAARRRRAARARPARAGRHPQPRSPGRAGARRGRRRRGRCRPPGHRAPVRPRGRAEPRPRRRRAAPRPPPESL